MRGTNIGSFKSSGFGAVAKAYIEIPLTRYNELLHKEVLHDYQKRLVENNKFRTDYECALWDVEPVEKEKLKGE